MLNQQLSFDQSYSQSSAKSQQLLTFPQLIQTTILPDFHTCSAHQQYVTRHVNFEDLQSLHKPEHKESLEEGELIYSGQSLDRRDINSNQLDEVDEQYKSLRQFQIEVLNVQQRKLISNPRKLSDTSEISSKPKQYRKLSENLDSSSKHQNGLDLIQMVRNNTSASPKFNGKYGSPLIQKQENRQGQLHLRSQWSKKTLICMHFIGKLMTTTPKITHQYYLNLLNDLGSNLTLDKQSTFNPYQKIIYIINRSNNWFQIMLLLSIYLYLAFDLPILIIIYFGFTIFSSICNYNIGVYNKENYISQRKVIIRQRVLIDILNLLGGSISLFINKWGVFLCLISLIDIWNKNKMGAFMFFIFVLIIQISICVVADQLSDLIFEQGFPLYLISAEWTIYKLTNSGNSDIAFEQNEVMRIMSILLALAGYFIQIWLLKLIIQFQPQQVYPISQELNDRIDRFRNRPKLQNYKFDDLRADIACQLKQELYLPYLQKGLPFSEKLKLQLCQFVESQIYHDGDYLLKENEVMDFFFFIIKGNIGEFKYKKQITANRIPLESFYKLKPHPLSLKCVSECQIGKIKFEDFLNEIRKIDQDFQTYNMMKDNYKSKCQICGFRNHQFLECKYVFYIPNYKQLIKEHNKSVPNFRQKLFRDEGRHRVNALINKNLICITAMSFAISNKLRSETELTNDVISKLQGSCNNFEDSVLNDFQDEKSSKFSHYQKHQTGADLNKNMSSPQNTISSQTYTYQQQLTPAKLEERESTYNSRKLIGMQKHGDQSQSFNSIKVNIVKSTVSNDIQMKRQQRNKKYSSSSSSINKRMLSTSIMQPKSLTGSIIPQIIQCEDDLDLVQSYIYYFPSYNIKNIAKKLNRRKVFKYQVSFHLQNQ